VQPFTCPPEADALRCLKKPGAAKLATYSGSESHRAVPLFYFPARLRETAFSNNLETLV